MLKKLKLWWLQMQMRQVRSSIDLIELQMGLDAAALDKLLQKHRALEQRAYWTEFGRVRDGRCGQVPPKAPPPRAAREDWRHFPLNWTVVLVVLLSGCSSTPYWVKAHPPLKALPPVVIDALPATYGHVNGWAVRNRDGTCSVYISARAPNRECTLAHELKHCAGYDHPHYPASLACFTMPLPRL